MPTPDRTPDHPNPDHQNPDRAPDGPPSVVEIAELTRRLRELTTAGRSADPAARAAFLADKQALLARIEHASADAGLGDARPPATAYDDQADDQADGDAAEDAGWSR